MGDGEHDFGCDSRGFGGLWSGFGGSSLVKMHTWVGAGARELCHPIDIRGRREAGVGKTYGMQGRAELATGGPQSVRFGGC